MARAHDIDLIDTIFMSGGREMLVYGRHKTINISNEGTSQGSKHGHKMVKAKFLTTELAIPIYVLKCVHSPKIAFFLDLH